MSKAFYEVEYEGIFQSVSAYLKDKIDCSTHFFNNNKFLVELNSDDKEELMFFSNSQMEDSFSRIRKVKNKNNKIVSNFFISIFI